MLRFFHRMTNNPYRAVCLLWPLAMLGPFVPGLPRPDNGGMTWRQEFILALLLCLSLEKLFKRVWKEDGAKAVRLGRFELVTFAPLAAFVLWSTASTLWATNKFPAVHYALSWGLYLLFFLVVWRAARHARMLRASLTTLGAIVLVIGTSNIVGHLGSSDSLLRENGLGEPLAFAVPFFAALALKLRRRRAALFCGAAASTAWLSVLQTSERAQFIGVCVGLALLAATMSLAPRFRPRSRARLALVVAVFAAVFALQAAPSPFGESRHSDVLTRLGSTSRTEENTQARLLYWAAAIEMARSRPLTGVGANNFTTTMPSARASFAARHTDSPLVAINEKFICAGAHNEYLQILAELGAIGFTLFAAFCALLVWAAVRALRRAATPLVPAAISSLAVFAISSGASGISLRWMGSGLIFFFAAAIVTRFAALPSRRVETAARRDDSAPSRRRPPVRLSHAFMRRAVAAALLFAILAATTMSIQAVNVTLLAAAQSSAERSRAERLYALSLSLIPPDPAAHFNFGMWLSLQQRQREALPHLRFAVERGFNTSTCYAYLAAAEEGSGDPVAAARTLGLAVGVYPRSVFLRVRHAAALERAGRAAEARAEMDSALLLDSRAARGWYELIVNDIDAAIAAARRDTGVAMPGELYPDDAVFAVLAENEKRFPASAQTGWRAQMRGMATQ
jgi:O-antigen ligase